VRSLYFYGIYQTNVGVILNDSQVTAHQFVSHRPTASNYLMTRPCC